MKMLNAKIMQSITCRDDLTIKDVFGSGSGLKDCLKSAGFKIGDEVVILLKSDLDDMIDRYSRMAAVHTGPR